MDQSRPSASVVEETQEESANNHSPRRCFWLAEGLPESGQFMAVNTSFDSIVRSSSHQSPDVNGTVYTYASLEKEDADDQTESESEVDLPSAQKMIECPPATISPGISSLSRVAATRSSSSTSDMRHSVKDSRNPWSTDAPTGAGPRRTTKPTSCHAAKNKSQPEAERSTKETSPLAIAGSDPQDLPAQPGQEEERDEPPMKRCRVRKSLRTNVGPTSSGTEPATTELFLSSHVRLDDKSRIFLESQAVSTVKNPKQFPPDWSTLVHVVPDKGPFRTVKVLRTLTAGGVVVKRSWIRESLRKSKLEKVRNFIPNALKNSIGRDRKSVFANKTLIFTSKAHSQIEQWEEVCGLAIEAGCAKICVASQAHLSSPPPGGNVCLFGENKSSDKDAATWIRVHHRVVWDRHLLARAIIAGEFDPSDAKYQLCLPLGTQSIQYEYC